MVTQQIKDAINDDIILDTRNFLDEYNTVDNMTLCASTKVEDAGNKIAHSIIIHKNLNEFNNE